MKNDLSCEVVQDLLPSYMDNLTNAVTNEAVKRHLDECEKCRGRMQRMQKDEDVVNNELSSKEIDFLKILKKETNKKIFISVGCVLAAVVLIICLKVFVIGSELSAQEVAYQMNISARDGVKFSNLSCLSSAKNVSSISYHEEEGGILRITLHGVLSSPLPMQKKLQTTYQPKQELTRVYIGDLIVWDEGVDIAPRVSAVYLSRHEYVGNMPENAETVQALGMKETLGDFENELLTDQAPYGWKIILKSDISMSDKVEIETKMKGYAALLLATIDNLEYVTYDYNVKTYISGIEEKTLTVTAEDAKELYHLEFYHVEYHEDGSYDIIEESFKEQEWTPADLQHLMVKAKLMDWRW